MKAMFVLAIDTSTADVVTGVVDTRQPAKAVAEAVLDNARHNNKYLVTRTIEVLESAGVGWEDLAAIVVGCGPGPFTGLRVGMATAAAFGDARGLPVYGVCSHDALAEGLEPAPSNGDTLVITDARRREAYWSRYRDGERVAGPDVCRPADLPTEGICMVAGPAEFRPELPGDLAALPRVAAAPRPQGLVAIAPFGEEPGPLQPLYLRRPDAVPPSRRVSPAVPRVQL